MRDLIVRFKALPAHRQRRFAAKASALAILIGALALYLVYATRPTDPDLIVRRPADRPARALPSSDTLAADRNAAPAAPAPPTPPSEAPSTPSGVPSDGVTPSSPAPGADPPPPGSNPLPVSLRPSLADAPAPADKPSASRPAEASGPGTAQRTGASMRTDGRTGRGPRVDTPRASDSRAPMAAGTPASPRTAEPDTDAPRPMAAVPTPREPVATIAAAGGAAKGLGAARAAQCAQAEFLSKLICEERVRLRFCRDRWNDHPDCRVEAMRDP